LWIATPFSTNVKGPSSIDRIRLPRGAFPIFAAVNAAGDGNAT
jgi:hypothetical protein